MCSNTDFLFKFRLGNLFHKHLCYICWNSLNILTAINKLKNVYLPTCLPACLCTHCTFVLGSGIFQLDTFIIYLSLASFSKVALITYTKILFWRYSFYFREWINQICSHKGKSQKTVFPDHYYGKYTMVKGKFRFISTWCIYHKCGHCDSMGHAYLLTYLLCTRHLRCRDSGIQEKQNVYWHKLREPPTAFQIKMFLTFNNT